MDGILRSVRARFHVTDEQYVERVRRGVASFDRWRRLAMVLHGMLTLAYVALFVALVKLANLISGEFFKGSWWLTSGLLIGILLGWPVGLWIHQLLQGWATILGGMRKERLLVAYHDALESPRHDRTAGQPPASRR